MTYVDIKNFLYTYFLSEDIFIVPNGLKLINSDLPEENIKAAVLLVLEEFEKLGLIINLGKECFMATIPFTMRSQNIELSAPLVSAIADLINNYRRANDITASAPNKLQLTEEDIGNLLIICQDVLIDPEGDKDSETE